MKISSTSILVAAGLALFTMTASSPVKNTDAIGITFFEGTWQQALDQAAKEKKIIFLDAYAAWCGPCKYLKATVFTDPKVGEYYNAKFINVKMDMEKGEGPALARKFGVTAYPTLFFVNADGTVKQKSIGFVNAEQLILMGKTVVDTKS